MMTVHWYPYHLQPYKVVFLVASARKTPTFAPKYEMPGENMVEFGKTTSFDCPHVFRYPSTKNQL